MGKDKILEKERREKQQYKKILTQSEQYTNTNIR
jgi:hypothetical protein